MFTGAFLGTFVVKWILKLPPHLAYVATLPCETSLPAKQAINEKSQGSVATYLGAVGLLMTQFTAESTSEKLFLNQRIFGKVTSKSVVASLHAWPTHC